MQSDFTRCPYCGAKLQVDPNDKVEKVKQGFVNFLSKAKDFFISAGKLAMSHKKITIALSAVLVLLIVLIPIITTFSNPLHPNNVAKVDVGVLTEQDVTKTYGQPSNVINAHSIQGMSLGAAQGMCREAWIYYDDAFTKKLKAFEDKFNNAESFEDLEKLDKEYTKLINEKFDCFIVGFDSDKKVSFVCLNKNAKYDELDAFASAEPKEFKEIELSKSTLCRGSSVADSNITYTAKYKDGSLVKARINTNGTTNEEQTATKILIQSIFGEYTVNLKMVDHSFDSKCLCKNCGLTIHSLNKDCFCNRCKNTVHEMQGCECVNCSYDTHERNSECVCSICEKVAHKLDYHCQCTICNKYFHSFDENLDCENCDTAFTIESNGLTCTITDFQGYGDVVIPSTYKGMKVTCIGEDAFSDCSSLTSITIPDSVTSIGYKAFYRCSKLTSITIGAGVTSIEERAFHNCNRLTRVNITDIAKWCAVSFGGYASNPLSYTNYLYINGELVTDLVIPDGVTSIGNDTFSDCSSLTSITIPDSVTRIGNGAFSDCSGLTSITIGAGVTSIEEYAFAHCSSLTSITIPDSVTSIGHYAFGGCSSLTSVIIGNGVTSIGDSSFYGCDSLTKVDITDLAKWCAISFGNDGANPLAYAEDLYLKGELVTDLVIPDSVTYIYTAFSGCSSLTSITIPNSVTSIGAGAFSGCSNLTSITIPNSVTSIGAGAFNGCRRLTSITIPESVTSIGYRAFYGCSSLTSVTIPDSVTSIGGVAFYGCSSLTSVTIPNSVTSIGEYAFYDCYSLIEVYNKSYLDIVAGSVNYGDVASYAKNVYTEEGGSKLGTIGDYVIYTDGTDKILVKYTGSDTELTLPSGITEIYKYAFNGYSNLTSMTIQDGVTSIGYKAFYRCSKLTSITMPNGVMTIGDEAFYGCSSLTSITIPNSVTSIGEGAFANCSSLTSITIPDGVTSLGGSTFAHCSSLTSVTIGSGVTSIEEYAFAHCSSLTSITFQGTQAQWNAISKGNAWNYNTGNYTIYCTDGNISK